MSIFIKSLLNLLSETPFIQRMAAFQLFILGGPGCWVPHADLSPVVLSVGYSGHRL